MIPWLVAANEDGTKPPLVFLHTWASEKAHLRALAEHLGPDQPLYGIEPPDGVEAPYPQRTQQWVDYFRERLERLPLSEPYWLAGFSFGGVVGLELARQLEADGHEVAYVGLVDTTRPKLNPNRLWPFLRYHLVEVALVAPGSRRQYGWRAARRFLGGTHMRVKRRTHRAMRRLGLRSDAPETLGDVKKMSPLMRSVQRSYLTYEASICTRPVSLFWTRGSMAAAENDMSLRWSRYLRGGFDVYGLQGPHMRIFDDEFAAANAAALARSLAVTALRRSLSAGGPAPRPPADPVQPPSPRAP